MNTTGSMSEGPDDLPGIIELDQKYFPHPWTPEQWQGLNHDQHQVLAWKNQEKILGFALFATVPGDDVAHLYKILVHPEARGSKVILEFWSAILGKLRGLGFRQVYLEVEASNERAVGFYKKVGFVSLRRVKGYYSNGSDGLMLQLML